MSSEMPSCVLEKIAKKLNKLGHEYYDKGETNMTAIFWELEGVIRQVLKEREPPK